MSQKKNIKLFFTSDRVPIRENKWYWAILSHECNAPMKIKIKKATSPTDGKYLQISNCKSILGIHIGEMIHPYFIYADGIKAAKEIIRRTRKRIASLSYGIKRGDFGKFSKINYKKRIRKIIPIDIVKDLDLS